MGTEWQDEGAAAVGEEAEVADAHEAAGKQVQEEAAQELIDGQSHQPLLVAVSGVSPTEGDVAIGQSHEPMIGDGDAMGVSAEIAQRMFRATERPLGVDHPVVAEQDAEPGGKGVVVREEARGCRGTGVRRHERRA